MAKLNAANERVKRRYLTWLAQSESGYCEASIDAALKAIHRFECYTGCESFKSFRIEQAIGFKKQLHTLVSRRTGERLSMATIKSGLGHLRKFFHWLAEQPGFKSAVRHSDAEYFGLSAKDNQIANERRHRPVPNLPQAHYLLDQMPTNSDIERRDRALIACALVTGARAGALASLKIKHIDLANGVLVQDGAEVATKFSKTLRTSFFPVGGRALDVLTEWVHYLKHEKLFGPDDPLFPATETKCVDGSFAPVGLARHGWSDATPIERIFRKAFSAAGLPPYNPHSFRKTLAQLGQQLCTTPEAFKAWSQNLGHEGVLTTFTSYGSVPPDRQAEIIRNLGEPAEADDLDDLLRRAAAVARRR